MGKARKEKSWQIRSDKSITDKTKITVMARYILQKHPNGLTDGKKVIYPKMQTYSMHDFDTGPLFVSTQNIILNFIILNFEFYVVPLWSKRI